jgi:hypothetical protein
MLLFLVYFATLDGVPYTKMRLIMRKLWYLFIYCVDSDSNSESSMPDVIKRVTHVKMTDMEKTEEEQKDEQEKQTKESARKEEEKVRDTHTTLIHTHMHTPTHTHTHTQELTHVPDLGHFHGGNILADNVDHFPFNFTTCLQLVLEIFDRGLDKVWKKSTVFFLVESCSKAGWNSNPVRQ